ncbi:MAG: type II toxin-antitoxin system VapC family toxin [Actinobacteria bacterium]|nr:type II toxin-antitoxin system VapC family toxin [Actinomycetota bacterium]
MNADYLDSSAIVKLVVREHESDALAEFLDGKPVLVSSALAKTEVLRALLPLGEEAQRRAETALEAIELIAISDDVLDAAGRLPPATLRSLDAIHLATAVLLGSDLQSLLTYDRRMRATATAMGMKAASPGAP